MARFSPFVIKALVDAITGGAGNDTQEPLGIYRSGPKIEQFFLDCGLDMRIGSSSRVPATTEFLRSVAATDDAAFIRVMLRVTDPREYLGNEEKGRAVLARLNGVLEADGFALTIVGGKSQLVTRQASGAIVVAIVEKTMLLDFDTVQRDIARAQQGLTDDPEDTVNDPRRSRTIGLVARQNRSSSRDSSRRSPSSQRPDICRQGYRRTAHSCRRCAWP